MIDVGGGTFRPVSPTVWEYEVSGLKVVQSWLGYRMKNRKGKKSSPLDDITPRAWGSEYTSEFLHLLNLLTHSIALQPQQAALLDAIIAGPLLPASARPRCRNNGAPRRRYRRHKARWKWWRRQASCCIRTAILLVIPAQAGIHSL